MTRDIYSMELHDELVTHDGFIEIRRVPGGWVYTSIGERADGTFSRSSCFVPFDNEFQQKS